MESNNLEIDFLGQKIHLKTQADADIVKEVTRIASMKIGDAEKRARKAAPHQIALLALFDLAEDYIRSKKKHSQYRKRINEKLDRLGELLDGESA